MNISDMHVWFRQYAQQMGMQNVRAILPEQIDILINTSITDTVNQIIRENVGITNDRVITDNSKIGQINALKHLYKVKEIKYQVRSRQINIIGPTASIFYGAITNLSSGKTYSDIATVRINFNSTLNVDIPIDYVSKSPNGNPLPDTSVDYIIDKFANLGYTIYRNVNIGIINRETGIVGVRLAINFKEGSEIENLVVKLLDSGNNVIGSVTKDALDADSSKGRYVIVEGAYYTNFDFNNKNYYNGLITLKENLQDYLFLVDFSIDYCDASTGLGLDITYLENFRTNLFPIRLIDDAYLADTLNDFILRPRLRSPIAIIVNNNLNIYLGKLKGNTTSGYFLDNNLVPDVIRVAYIAKPAIVKYSEDINGQNVDCDLPDYMHVDILKHAVDLYRAAISGGIAASQASEQAQNQENVRNNYRNEGYQ